MFKPHSECIAKLSNGVDIHYTDSGAPRSTNYVTLVILHGSGFNGAVFNPLHEFAHRSNLRTIAWNRRGYGRSTDYTDGELADLRAGRQVHQDRLAFQLAEFLGHFIETKDTPKLGSDRKTGGFIIVGWSFGNATTLSLFASPGAIPKPLYELIEPYIMSFVLYDPPFAALGYPSPDYENLYDPWTDPTCLSPEQRFNNFQHWVSSYYKHPDISSGSCSGLDFRKRTKMCTSNRWSEVQKAFHFDKMALVRTEAPS
ncbi:Alpha/Beta hydrolase protein [Collybia nuda]|uniref:Alpha/Beta hydrolase protein n=1 Tax=Collybia nuda TaxID=64659 RepID=A0A9P5Y3B4_9AGAR|nr:Alpha/Beta hydrolase protein [Collybia nuda]